jgi:hypothetical protein
MYVDSCIQEKPMHLDIFTPVRVQQGVRLPVSLSVWHAHTQTNILCQALSRRIKECVVGNTQVTYLLIDRCTCTQHRCTCTQHILIECSQASKQWEGRLPACLHATPSHKCPKYSRSKQDRACLSACLPRLATPPLRPTNTLNGSVQNGIMPACLPAASPHHPVSTSHKCLTCSH